VDFKRGVIDYGLGHGNKRRATVRLNKQALDALKAAKELACSEYLIEYHGRPLKTVKKGFTAACKRAGIVGVTPHILRHSGATWMALDGVPLSEIAAVLGDREATVERVYRKFTPEYQVRATDALQFGK
jgi:integrase